MEVYTSRLSFIWVVKERGVGRGWGAVHSFINALYIELLISGRKGVESWCLREVDKQVIGVRGNPSAPPLPFFFIVG